MYPCRAGASAADVHARPVTNVRPVSGGPTSASRVAQRGGTCVRSPERRRRAQSSLALCAPPTQVKRSSLQNWPLATARKLAFGNRTCHTPSPDHRGLFLYWRHSKTQSAAPGKRPVSGDAPPLSPHCTALFRAARPLQAIQLASTPPSRRESSHKPAKSPPGRGPPPAPVSRC